MWIIAKDGFLSVVRDRNSAKRLLVQTRRREDLTSLFPEADVIESRDGDYPFRASLPEEEVAKTIAARLGAIDYGNFKDAIEDRDLSAFAHQVWCEGLRLQEDTD
jgi:hypothetical protein